jgi:hypothetical protein
MACSEAVQFVGRRGGCNAGSAGTLAWYHRIVANKSQYHLVKGSSVDLTKGFWRWYERHYQINVAITLVLFLLQVVHLYWLTGDVVWYRLFNERLLTLGTVFEYLILLVDYTEIPALVSTSLVYVHELRKGFRWRSLLLLLFLNSQWLHIFWITDEFVVGQFQGDQNVLPTWLAWMAIGIDYLELPVIVDLARRFLVSLRQERLGAFIREELP